mmetsp:Transcript_50237/g.79738  ORF Transcript_50237/g.79738 Transcript_50237/m.79738 type:complete len:80 (+) Transcript_50237:703-942(+)
MGERNRFNVDNDLFGLLMDDIQLNNSSGTNSDLLPTSCGDDIHLRSGGDELSDILGKVELGTRSGQRGDGIGPRRKLAL